jgi:ligand-binding SRPBCC domain-containing protein
VTDRVEYALPFGSLARRAHALLVRRQLGAIFDYRRQAMAEVFGLPVARTEHP